MKWQRLLVLFVMKVNSEGGRKKEKREEKIKKLRIEKRAKKKILQGILKLNLKNKNKKIDFILSQKKYKINYGTTNSFAISVFI